MTTSGPDVSIKFSFSFFRNFIETSGLESNHAENFKTHEQKRDERDLKKAEPVISSYEKKKSYLV